MAQELLEVLYSRHLLQVWPRDNADGWTLHSGIWSPFYVDLRGLSSLKDGRAVLELVGDAFSAVIRENAPQITRIVGVSTGGIPIAVATTMRSGIPSCYTRRSLAVLSGANELPGGKSWGDSRFLEGDVLSGDKLLLVDDLITDGSSKLEALNAVNKEAERRGVSVECRDVAVILDRGQGGPDRLKGLGVRLHALIPMRTVGLKFFEDRLTRGEARMISSYLDDPLSFASKDSRAVLHQMVA
jgi:orotate phosphoribosyltransferase